MAKTDPFVPSKIFAGDFSDIQVPTPSDAGRTWVWNPATLTAELLTLNYEPAGAVAAHAALTNGVHGISAFGATLVDDADAATARTTLGLGALATASVPGSSGQVIFNNAGALAGDVGMTYDAANDALTVAGRVVTGVIRPASDSTTAVQVQTAAGGTGLIFDSTNVRLGIGVAPTSRLKISDSQTGAVPVFLVENTANGTLPSFGLVAPNLSGNYIYFTIGKEIGLYQRAGVAYQHVADNDPLNRLWIGFYGADNLFNFCANGRFGLGSSVTAPTALLDIAASTTTRASLRIRPGAFPTGTNRNDGDIGYVSSGRLMMYRGSTEEIFATGVQAAGGAATAGAAYTAAEQSMLQKVYDAARTFGLLS